MPKSYDSYGLPQATTGFRNSFTFTGREWDGDLGLMYYRARYYDPVEGAFISRDPLGIESGTANLYGYVGQNPGNYTDPSGLIAPAIAVPLYYAGAKMLAAGTAWFGYKAATTSMRASGLVSNKQACDAQKAGNNAMKSVAAINAVGAPLAMGPGLATYYGPSLYASGMAWAGTGAGQGFRTGYGQDVINELPNMIDAWLPGPPPMSPSGYILGSYEFLGTIFGGRNE